MACQLEKGQIKIWCGMMQNCESHNNGTPATAVPILSKTAQSVTDPNNPSRTISTVGMTAQNWPYTNPMDYILGIYVLNAGTYGTASLEQYNADLNKLKTVAVPPGTKCVINYDIVNAGSPLCTHEKGENNTGFLYVKENPMQVMKKNLLGVESLQPNTECVFITCNDILNLPALVSRKKNHTLYINTITSETIEHFDGKEILTNTICGVKRDFTYWMLLCILVIYFIYVMYQ